MFEEVVRKTVRVGKGRNWYTALLSVMAHAVIIGLLIIISLWLTNNLPKIPTTLVFVAPVKAPPPPPLSVSVSKNEGTKTGNKPLVNPNAAPTEAPRVIEPEKPYTTLLTIPGNNNEVINGIPCVDPSKCAEVGENLGSPLPVPKAKPLEPIRIGGKIKHPSRIKYVNPIYPKIALSARVEGYVIVEAIIGTDGKVTGMKILKSIPLLDQVALDAVRQWQYTPTFLNDTPVPVIITVTVTFTLR